MNKLFFLLLSCIVTQGSVNAMDEWLTFFMIPSLPIAEYMKRFPLHKAVRDGDIGLVNTLLLSNNRPDINLGDNYGKTPLHIATYNGQQEIIKILLDRGANINLQNIITGKTPLHYAVDWMYLPANESTVKILLDRGANINLQSQRGITPLHIAAQRGHKAIVKLFLDKGTDINSQGAHGETALWEAVTNGQKKIIKLLLNRGANVNLQNIWQDTRGETLLHCVIKYCCNPVVVQQFLEHGAYNDMKDKKGHTPLNLAMKFLNKGSRDKNQMQITVELLKFWQKVVETAKNERLAFCMAMHEHVGTDSPANLLSQYLFQEICSYIRPEMDDQTTAEYNQLCQKIQPQTACTVQ